MVVTIPSSASSTAFPSSLEKTRGNSCAGGRRSRVIALSVCLRDSAWRLRSLSARKPCTFGTHLRVLQSFLRPRFAFSPSRDRGAANKPRCRSREHLAHPEGLTEILTRPLYALTSRQSTTISLNVTCWPCSVVRGRERNALAMPHNVAHAVSSQCHVILRLGALAVLRSFANGVPSQWLRDAYEWNPAAAAVLD